MNSCSGIMSAVICDHRFGCDRCEKLAEALAPPSRQHRTTAPFCSPLFIRLLTGRSSLFVRNSDGSFFLATFTSLSPHISPVCWLFPSVFLLYVLKMTLAQCSPLVVIFMVHFGTASLSFLVFLVASIISNTMGMFFLGGGVVSFKKRLYLESWKRQTVYLTTFISDILLPPASRGRTGLDGAPQAWGVVKGQMFRQQQYI